MPNTYVMYIADPRRELTFHSPQRNHAKGMSEPKLPTHGNEAHKRFGNYRHIELRALSILSFDVVSQTMNTMEV